jgi:mycoredoxin
MADKIIVYGHPACPQVGPLLGALKQTGVEYTYINIWHDEPARAQVRALNEGNETVPSLVFLDGGVLSEPSFRALEARLSAMGYQVPLRARLTANVWVWVIGLGVLLAVLRALGVF